jgi:hypothetical protein
MVCFTVVRFPSLRFPFLSKTQQRKTVKRKTHNAIIGRAEAGQFQSLLVIILLAG